MGQTKERSEEYECYKGLCLLEKANARGKNALYNRNLLRKIISNVKRILLPCWGEIEIGKGICHSTKENKSAIYIFMHMINWTFVKLWLLTELIFNGVLECRYLKCNYANAFLFPNVQTLKSLEGFTFDSQTGKPASS